MIVSPGSRCSRSSSIWASVASPAGTMIQTARGFSSLATSSSIENAADRPLAGDLLRLLRRPVVGDDLVAVAEQAADHVRAHPAESDETDLHPWSLPVGRGRGLTRSSSAGRLVAAVDQPAGEGLRVEGGLEGRQVRFRIRQVDPDDRQVVRLDRLEVTLGLGVDELAEGVRPARDRSIGRMVAT